MKAVWLILVFVVGSSALLDTVRLGKDKAAIFNGRYLKAVEKRAKNELDEVFEDFSDLAQHVHPSLASPINRVITCIEEKGLLEPMKEFLAKIMMNQIKNSSLEERKDYCDKNVEKYIEVLNCIPKVKSEDFSYALHATAEQIFAVGCIVKDPNTLLLKKSEVLTLLADMPKYANYVKKYDFMLRHKIQPTEKDYCLPIRVAEAYEIAAIKSHRVPLFNHGNFASATQVLAILHGKYPFKTVEECDV